MKLHRPPVIFGLLLMSILASTDVAAQQTYQLSSKFYEADFTRTNHWTGEHRFGNVFCLTFPRSTEVKALAYAMYNNNALYFSRASYSDMTALYAVASTIPPGRSVDVEIGNLENQNQRSIDAHPENFKQSRVGSLLGPSIALTVRNSTEGTKEAPFPFSRSIVRRPEGLLESLSVHRLFVRGNDRIEIAGLRYFTAPIEADFEAQAISDLTALVEDTAKSMQSCTLTLPTRSQ